ncbi:two-component system sensor histidine kinase CreC [Chitinimonas arctica]|uniref:histidine kinase n=1 Tax=Chitinimonas arctica TaxID=2594795 RepID=A0A516SG07_9NEIS|nr:two-component system sensor histidine kinase CreC [Chitinimonas arctica]QDQ27099.1 two-component system sensor histidine kinase CreC [Chitinimonas arctica]
MRIGIRIFLGYFVMVGLVAWFLLDTSRERLRPALKQSMEDTLVDTANLLAEFSRRDLVAGTVAKGEFARNLEAFADRRLNAEIWGIRKDKPNHRIYVTDAQGMVLYDSNHLADGQDYSRWNDVYLTLQGRYGARTTRGDPADPTSSVMHVAAPVQHDGKLIGVVTVAKPIDSVRPFFQQALDGLTRAGGLVLVAGGLLGLLLSWWITRSLTRLEQYAQAVARGERVSLPALSGREVRVLGQALDTMRNRLEGKQYVEQYVHGLTHELKSPLAGIRGAAELIEPSMPAADQARFLRNIRTQAERMTEIIDRMLTLAQLESRQALADVEEITVASLLRQACDDKAEQLRARGLVCQLEVAETLRVRGERFLLGQALSNLLDNAIAFAPGDSALQLRAEAVDGVVRVSLRDQGPGVPDYALNRVFERFYSLPRPDGGTRSTGLGLPFVREVAALHGGSISLRNHEAGGAVAVLDLPAGKGRTGQPEK